jgi:hypothetical protein
LTVLDSKTAQAAAHRLLVSGMPEHGTPDATAAGAEYVFAHLFRNLSQWIGTAGCHALFTRAIVLSVPRHPVLTGVRHHQQGAPHLDRLTENAREYGSQATAEGAIAMLATIITMLTGLIGEDIAMSLLEEVPTRTSEITTATASDNAPGLTPRTDQGEVAS